MIGHQLMKPPRKVPPRDDYYMGIAFWIASRSKDPNTQVGAVLAHPAVAHFGVGDFFRAGLVGADESDHSHYLSPNRSMRPKESARSNNICVLSSSGPSPHEVMPVNMQTHFSSPLISEGTSRHA